MMYQRMNGYRRGKRGETRGTKRGVETSLLTEMTHRGKAMAGSQWRSMRTADGRYERARQTIGRRHGHVKGDVLHESGKKTWSNHVRKAPDSTSSKEVAPTGREMKALLVFFNTLHDEGNQKDRDTSSDDQGAQKPGHRLSSAFLTKHDDRCQGQKKSDCKKVTGVRGHR